MGLASLLALVLALVLVVVELALSAMYHLKKISKAKECPESDEITSTTLLGC